MKRSIGACSTVKHRIFGKGHVVALIAVLAVLFVGFSSIFIYARDAAAATNDTINFQARVLKSGGAVINDGATDVEFKLYTVSSGGTSIWTESHSVAAKNGYIQASLGSITPFPGTIDWSQEHWITLNIEGDGEMNPRMKMTAVPYSFRSGKADTLTNGSGSISASQLAQLAPGSIQGVSSSNAALRINQTGAGDLLQLQGDGGDVLSVSKTGDITTTGALTVGNTSSTTAGTIRWNGVDFEGYDGSSWVSLTSGTGGGGGGSSTVATVIKTSNQIVNNTAALQNDSELTFPVAANDSWAFRFVVQANSGTTPDLRFAVTAPSGATCRVAFSDPEGGTSVGQYGCGVSTASIPGNGTVDLYEITGTIENGSTAGSVTLQWAQFTANASNTTVYAGSYLLATKEADAGVSAEFLQGGNAFDESAILGTTDNFNLNFVTNGNTRLSVTNTGSVSIVNDLTVGNGLTVSSGGATIVGDSTITGNLSGLTGLEVSSGGLTVGAGGADISGGLELNSGGITNAGDIIGLGTSLSAAGGLTISTGGGNDLALNSDSGILVIGADTLQRTAAGVTAISLNDSSDTELSIINNDGTAVANLQVEGQVTASGFNGNGSGLTSLNASNISSGSIGDGLLSSNVALLNTAQVFSAQQTFSAGIILGNTASAVNGALRWTGADFEGYNGSEWVSLTSGGGGGSGNVVRVVKEANEVVNNSASLQDDDELTFAITSDETIAFRFVVQANSGTTPDLRFAVTAPSGATCRVSYSDPEGASSNGQYGCGVSTASIPGNGAVDLYEITGTVTNGSTAGDVTLRWAQFTANASNTTVYAGSYLVAYTETVISGGPITAFEQGGNAFGAAAIIGTTDANDLALVTSGLTRISVSASGDTSVSGGLTANGALIVNSTATFNESVVIGDDATDTLTINSSNIVLPNDLLFDGGTFAIDATNNKVGINNSSPLNILSINTPTVADNLADVLIATSSSSQKGLVIQSQSSQTANLIEAQDEAGTNLFAVSATGSLVLGNDSATPQQGSLIFNDGVASNGFTSVLGTSSLTSSQNISLPDESGTICLSDSSACGFVKFAESSAQVDSSTNSSIFINKTGASGDLLTLQKNGQTVLSALNDGALRIQLDSDNAFLVNDSTGENVFSVNTNNGLVRIGSSGADSTGVLLVLDTKNTAGDPTGENGGMYYNSSTNKFRCFQDGAWVDCIGTRQIRSYPDTTSDAAADNNTTNYWDTGSENGNSYPFISPSTTNKSVAGSVVIEVSSTSTADRSIVARVERGIGAPPTCGSGTVVGSRISTFTTNSGEIAAATIFFVDSPSSTSDVYYTLCADTATSAAGGMTINSIRFTLEEANNSF